MSDFEEPGYAERDDDDFSEETGGGVGFDELEDVEDTDDDADFDFEDENENE